MIKNKKIFVAALLILCTFCCCAFSYAAFTTTLSAAGFVATNGVFDVYFVKNGTTTKYENGDTENLLNSNGIKIDAKYTEDDKNEILTITAEVPADFSSTTFNVRVHNGGTMNAVINLSDEANSGRADNVKTTDQTKTVTDSTGKFVLSCPQKCLVVGETADLTLTLSKADGTTLLGGDKSGTMEIKLYYTQEDATGTPSTTHYHFPTSSKS